MTHALGESTRTYKEKLDFNYAKGPMGVFFCILRKKKERNFYSIPASEHCPHALIFSNSDPLGNDGRETNLQKHEVNIKIEILKVLASCRF